VKKENAKLSTRARNRFEQMQELPMLFDSLNVSDAVAKNMLTILSLT
jgi:hypothetical protein